jgi:hypothetical protein
MIAPYAKARPRHRRIVQQRFEAGRRHDAERIWSQQFKPPQRRRCRGEDGDLAALDRQEARDRQAGRAGSDDEHVSRRYGYQISP